MDSTSRRILMEGVMPWGHGWPTETRGSDIWYFSSSSSPITWRGQGVAGHGGHWGHRVHHALTCRSEGVPSCGSWEVEASWVSTGNDWGHWGLLDQVGEITPPHVIVRLKGHDYVYAWCDMRSWYLHAAS